MSLVYNFLGHSVQCFATDALQIAVDDRRSSKILSRTFSQDSLNDGLGSQSRGLQDASASPWLRA